MITQSMRRRAVSALAGAALSGAGAVALAGAAARVGVPAVGARAPAGRPQAATPAARPVTVGRSVRGRPIRAWVVGSALAPRTVLVVGCVHGNERAGEAITRRLRGAVPPPGTALWLVDEFNPDGCRADTRQNARGVDLNRNSPWHWRRLDQPGGLFFSGRGPRSEPETRAIMRLVKRIRPRVSIWYHQHAALVDDSSGGSRRLERMYARLVGLPFARYGTVPGGITSWQDSTFPSGTAFVVELPAGPLTVAAVRRHARAVLAVAAAAGTPRAAGGGPGRSPSGTRGAPPTIRR